MTVFLQKRNPLTGAFTEWEVENEDYDYHQEIARSAFADMLHDTERNKKYYKALELSIKNMHRQNKKANVLDIGTGTGLLSMMAAKCGADTITACEAFKPMADCCLKILAHNGFADKIKVIPKRSTEITVGENGDMPEKANILVTEVFDTELIGEGALSTFTHAHKYLLEEDCIVIPDSAIIYAQVVESPLMQKFNKINDISDLDLGYVLKSPQKMKDCAGSAAVHDIQLSQLSRTAFTELSDPIPVLHYDWSGKIPLLMNQIANNKFIVSKDGTAQMVFMWWELIMWPGEKATQNLEGTSPIILSCAPWWSHPDVDINSHQPEHTIPWRDHWMQAVYYLPQEVPLKKNTEVNLVSCQDEYSLWFFLEDKTKVNDYQRPICECGVHMAWSRTHVSYINDEERRKKFMKQMKSDIIKNSVVLDLNGSCFMGLLAAKMAKKVYIHEQSRPNINILQDYINANNIDNVTFVSELTEDILKEVTNVICEPSFSSAILPWDNLLKMASTLYKHKGKFNAKVIPEAFELWAMPVEFYDLHRIRVPLKRCEGFDMSIFDDLIEKSRIISDDEIEAQPLWEYPSKKCGKPQLLVRVDLNNLDQKYAVSGTFKFDNCLEISNKSEGCKQVINGFTLWPEWVIGEESGKHSAGLQAGLDDKATYDMHSRQAVKILKNYMEVSSEHSEWWSKVVFLPENGLFNIHVNYSNKLI